MVALIGKIKLELSRVRTDVVRAAEFPIDHGGRYAEKVWSDKQDRCSQSRSPAFEPEDSEGRPFSRGLSAAADANDIEGKEVAMRGEVALIHEQGQDFAVVLVKDRVIRDPALREEMLAFAAQEFGVRPALMGERSLETYGPDDIVRWLSGVSVEQLPWREFSMNN